MKKFAKRLAVMFVAICLILTGFSGSVRAAGITAEDLQPELFGKVVPIEKTAGNVLPFNTNYYYGELSTGRIWKEYIPAGIKKYDNTILLNVPEGVNTEEFLVSSGWIDVAEANRCSLFILEPVDQHWADVDAEWAYLSEAFEKRTSSITSQEVYAVGYGEMGSLLQTYIMRRAMRISGAAFIDASDISPAALKAIGDSAIGDLVQTAGGPSIIGGEDYKVLNKQVPLPVWIIDADPEAENTAAVIRYWQAVNKTDTDGEDFNGGKIYRQTEEIVAVDDGWSHSFTPFGNVADVAVLKTEADINDGALARMIFDDFLSTHYRYTVNIWSSILVPALDYEEMGVELATMTDEEGYIREVLIYCPKEYREAGPLPVVFSNPGGGGTVDFLFKGSAMYHVADENGFICVCINGVQGAELTTGAGGRLSMADNEAAGDKDLHFVEDLLAYVAENYDVDLTRVYYTGIFNFPYYVSQNLRHIFAAQATSMAANAMLPKADTVIVDTIPLYLLQGEYEARATVQNMWRTPGTNYNTLVMNRLNIDGAFGEVTPETIPEPEELTEENPRYTTVEWKSPENGEPVIRLSVTADKAHAFYWEDVEMEWNFLKHWTLDLATGEHIYTE